MSLFYFITAIFFLSLVFCKKKLKTRKCDSFYIFNPTLLYLDKIYPDHFWRARHSDGVEEVESGCEGEKLTSALYNLPS